MSGKRSAGILLHRTSGAGLELLIGHMGGPFWSGRTAGAWSIPKGEYAPGEAPEAAAHREFTEELGLPVPGGELTPLGECRQASGKVVTIWALEADLDPGLAVFGTFVMEWPRGSGIRREFPELDEVAWCTPAGARELLVTGQRVFVDRLTAYVQDRQPSSSVAPRGQQEQ
ncbi:NUDIX domain-containing protein [Streptomyces hypolithicus]